MEMELSQSRPRGAQGAKPTHDFLSLYSPAQQDPTPRIPGGYLKPEGTQSSGSNNNDENSNCSSYTGSGFTLWEESKVKDKQTGLMPWMKSVKFDSNVLDQKSNSPRSKHSATEQRRRSKINDRFSMLRGIIPHADQKRDKASFLLEVIEYIQFLQEKVHKYEDSYQGWTNIPPDIKNNRPTEQPKLPNSTSDKLKDEQLIIESGMISISTIYSQGISSALTQALKRSGVDLSETNISVQIDLGKRPNTKLKVNDELMEEGNDEGLKRLKRSIN